jgi:single-strand DNA-binding protein
MNLNKAIICGRLTRDPETKALPSGQYVCSFSLATSRTWTDKDGNRQEEAEFHNVVVFGKAAENCGKYLVKGQLALVEGRIQTRSWEHEGQKQYRTEIVAESVQFGPKAGGSEQSSSAATAPDYPEDEINPDDIPF